MTCRLDLGSPGDSVIRRGKYWIDILPSTAPKAEFAGKWLCFGATEDLHAYVDLLDTLIEDGKLPGAKIARKDPSDDPFPHKPCVLCVFTTGDKTEVERVRGELVSIGLHPSRWKSEVETRVDWVEGGALRQEAAIVKKRRAMAAQRMPPSDHVDRRGDSPSPARPVARDIFISHAAADKEIAGELCDVLEGARISCWIAPRDIPPGVPYAKAIMDAINSARVLVLVLSSSANASPHTVREVERSFNRGIPILPLRVEPVQPTGELEYFLAGYQWLDALTQPLEPHARRLAEAVSGLLPAGKQDARAQEPPLATPGASNPRSPVAGSGGAGSPTAGLVDAVTGMEFVLVDGGEFEMGDVFGDGSPDERPVHKVAVGGFFLGRTPVTQGQWERVMGSNPSRFREGPDHPVENVSWLDATAFLEELNRISGQRYRLPTEAEWEYAARSGGKPEKWAGTSSPLDATHYGWFHTPGRPKTSPVGMKRPNGLGLYDMTGGVWEWCSDWYAADYYSNGVVRDPQGPPTGTDRDESAGMAGARRVYRGGSWLDPQSVGTTTYRGGGFPSGRASNHGFRVARSVD